MELVFTPGGVIRCIYGEAVDLAALGAVEIRRASVVEPDEAGDWWADMSPVNGPKLGPFHLHSEALEAEVDWLRRHVVSG